MTVFEVDSELQRFQTVAEEAMELYKELKGFHLKFLDYSENFTCLAYNDSGQKYILRVNRPFYHEKHQIKAEIAYIQNIAKQSPIQVALPIQTINGAYVNEHKIDNKIYYSTLFTFLNGSKPNENGTEIFRQFELLGQITAKMHKHSIENAVYYNTFDRMSWDEEMILGDHPKWGRWQDGKGLTDSRIEKYSLAVELIKLKLKVYGKSTMRYGLIHADLRLANLLVAEDGIKVIDFDDCGFGWYLYDLATALSFIEHLRHTPQLISAWIKGYEKERLLTSADKSMIETFVLMRRLQLIAWIGSRDNETTQQLDEQFTFETDPLVDEYLINHSFHQLGGMRYGN
ncbi:phosphotransferase enzyme family protein [Rummeliibacillus sp. SL167]|uniref:phosphotransferase enzyme family protein n=1 Tax=Rummeliibacillus sp. SL167 TaxID=2579792 RepID=UPI0011B7095B|nr:phosphotransferase [Rummeliibacillus sp. SL167]